MSSQGCKPPSAPDFLLGEESARKVGKRTAYEENRLQGTIVCSGVLNESYSDYLLQPRAGGVGICHIPIVSHPYHCITSIALRCYKEVGHSSQERMNTHCGDQRTPSTVRER